MSERIDVDVAIVGAGPAGCSTALHLLRRRPRARVALFDRATLPREKPCGGAISRLGLDALETIGATPADLGVPFAPVHAIRVRHGERVAEHATSGLLGAVVERAAFDHALARAAAARGAMLHAGHRLVKLQRGETRTELELLRDDGTRVEVSARVVVGADGTGSAVRRLAGFPEAGRRARLVVLETDEVPGDDVSRGVLEFDLSCVSAPASERVDGYVWHFATHFGGRPRVSRGIYDFRGHRDLDARALRDALESALVARGVHDGEARRKPYSERVFADPNAEVARASVLLVGEAAGLVDPVTGEGIAQAIVSGRVAADELVLGNGAVDPARYTAALSALRCHRHLRQTAVLAGLVYGPRAGTWASALAASDVAVSAGGDWYAGHRLGALRKLGVGVAFGWSLLRAALRARGEEIGVRSTSHVRRAARSSLGLRGLPA